MPIEAIAIGHGLFNGTMMILFFVQGWLGLAIRRARRRGAAIPAAIRRHRRNGPVFMLLGVLGFLLGLMLVLIGGKGILAFPVHFGVGLAIVLLLILTFALSRKIKRPDSPVRTVHALAGALVLVLYVIQTVIGLDLLL